MMQLVKKYSDWILLLATLVTSAKGGPIIRLDPIVKEGIEGRNISFDVEFPLQEDDVKLILVRGSKGVWTNDVNWDMVFEYHVKNHMMHGPLRNRLEVMTGSHLHLTLRGLNQSDDGIYKLLREMEGSNGMISDELYVKIHVREDICSYFKCSNGGTCLYGAIDEQPVCSCPDGYSGRLCEINDKGMAPPRPVLEVTAVEQLQKGDHIAMKMTESKACINVTFHHHAIVKSIDTSTKTVTVIHRVPDQVEIGVYDEEDDGPFYVVKHCNRIHDREETYKRAFGRLKEEGYNLRDCNCEHFANWCVMGEDISFQAEDRHLACTVIVKANKMSQ